MSDFWAKKLGVQAPQPVQQQPAVGPWWAVQKPPPAVTNQMYTPVVPTPQQPNPQPQQGEQHFGDLIRQDEYTTDKAQSIQDNERCPDCQSPNYVRSSQNPNSMKSCFDCGYNPRFQHSTHGATGIGQQNLPTRSARSQTMSTTPADFGAVIAHI